MTIAGIDRPGTDMRRHRGQQGSTIMLVTLIMALMGIIAIFLLYRVEAERLAAIYMEQRFRFQQTAEAVLQRYLGLLAADDKPEIDTQKDDWFAGGRVEFEENGYNITVIIEDEGSKPNLNLQDPEGLRVLLPVSSSEPPIPIDTLLDWLDMDDDPREKGAELREYQEMSPPYRPRNGFMSSIEEMKAIKDSDKFYSLLAPEVTVYGKINPNVLDPFMFRSFMNAIGFEQLKDKAWVDKICGEFEIFRFQARGRFKEKDDFLKNTSMMIPELEYLEQFIQFKGNCNLNFVNKSGLKMFIRQISLQMGRLGFSVDLNPDLAEGIINYRDNQPFTSLDTLFRNVIPGEGETYAPVNIGDYFTLVSRLIRYRIWVVKGSGKYYLETIQERNPVTGIRNWEINPLTWKTLSNNEVPEIPEPTPIPTPPG
ncbi:MAG: general secretion pathway protein GspK [Firmicutes bacterium]|nr:general secretion pathway protein GspK [Bacillota bacterium]